LSKNKLEYTVIPKECKSEYIFLSNVINYALVNLEREFDDKFKYAVGNYKQSKKESKKKYGWFHGYENLLYIDMQINQLKYVIYGDKFVRQLKWNEELGDAVYEDLIKQIDPTVLMTPKQLKDHNNRISKMAKEIMDEILAEENNNKR
jgi:hypothetical protein